MKSFIGFIIVYIAFSLHVSARENILQYSMSTPWTDKVDENNVWNHYPRPQMVRDNWINLNGIWEYAILSKNIKFVPNQFQGEILVPFPVESELSGVKKMVGDENYLWYRTYFAPPQLKEKEGLLLHFGAVDWEAVIILNGKELGTHKGGYDPFFFDIAPYLVDGKQELIVRVWDPTEKGSQPRGKQISEPRGIWYTPVTGIWQTVWLEKVPAARFELVKPSSDIDKRKLQVEYFTSSYDQSVLVELEVFMNGRLLSRKSIPHAAKSKHGLLQMDIPQMRLWSPDDPFLYDLDLRIISTDGRVLDEVKSYFGMRKISLGKDAKGYTRILLNNEPLFQYGMLDQGWWPDGLYTPPTEEAMIFDLIKTKEMGFNMLRKHVKIESARFYYACDKMGILVWQDMPNGNYPDGLRIQAWEPEDVKRPLESALQFEKEYKAMLDNFHIFPSIVVWVPFNEGWGQYDTERITEWTKAYDPTRLVSSASGWTDRGVGDMYDAHLYPGPGMHPVEENRASVLSEFGGLGLPVEGHLWWDKRNWGYLTFHDSEEFIREYQKLMKGLIGPISKGLSAAIYTQTTDVEGEVNGLMTYDRRKLKIDADKLRKINAPLYENYWDAYYIIPDSEIHRQLWAVSTQPENDNWKGVNFDDNPWPRLKAPFSVDDNPYLLVDATHWETENLYLRKEFSLTTIPERLILKHYMPRASAKIYLNGNLVLDLTDRGGRKRHYTYNDVSYLAEFLSVGKNIIAIELEQDNQSPSFDMGIFTTDIVK